MDPQSGKNKKVEHNTQIEPTDALLPLKDILARLDIQIHKNSTHFNESECIHIVQKVDKGTPTSNDLIIFTDLLATCDLCACKLKNCSQDAHTVLKIFAVCHSP